VIGELKQALVNLKGNALHAMHGEGFLRIRARLIGASVNGDPKIRIVIADNGTGIDKDTFERLFDAFNTTKGPARIGLALWMCQQITHRHSGKIQVKSNPHGALHGTAGRIHLPAGKSESQPRGIRRIEGLCYPILSFQPARRSKRFIGYEVMNPQIIPICIMNQYVAWLGCRCGWRKKIKKTTAIHPYIPT